VYDFFPKHLKEKIKQDSAISRICRLWKTYNHGLREF